VAKLQIQNGAFFGRPATTTVNDDSNLVTNQLDVSLLENIVNNALVLLWEDGAGGIHQVATGFRLRILHRQNKNV
jgi:Mlc titration factor MtfA (ptsG expression regulator)